MAAKSVAAIAVARSLRSHETKPTRLMLPDCYLEYSLLVARRCYTNRMRSIA